MEILQQLQKEFNGEIKSHKLYIKDLVLSETLGFIFIEGISGAFNDKTIRTFIKGHFYDELQYKFEMLEREYYKLQEEHDKAQLEVIELSGE